MEEPPVAALMRVLIRATLIMLRAQRCCGEGRLQQQPQPSLDSLETTHGIPPVAARAAVLDTRRRAQAAERRRRRRWRRRGGGIGGRLDQPEQPRWLHAAHRLPPLRFRRLTRRPPAAAATYAAAAHRRRAARRLQRNGRRGGEGDAGEAQQARLLTHGVDIRRREAVHARC